MKIGRNAAYAGLVLGVTIFFALRAFLSYGQGPGVYGAAEADGVLRSFFAGVAYPVGGRVLVPLDWLLMVAGAQAACAAVMALSRGRWGVQVTLRIGSSVKAWRLSFPHCSLCSLLRRWRPFLPGQSSVFARRLFTRRSRSSVLGRRSRRPG